MIPLFEKPDCDAAVAAIIMAAGRGSRMQGYAGNKTLLPLAPNGSPFQGRRPLLLHLVANLPAGPKAVIVNHCQHEVMAATQHLPLTYCEQPVLNGTGGALLAARDFIAAQPTPYVLITMGDVPLVQPETYARLVKGLIDHDMVVLGFTPTEKKRYGVLETANGRVHRITEWQYWKDYPAERQASLAVCNSGIYAARRETLNRYLPILASRPQVVHKMIDGRPTAIQEFFITDLIEFMSADGRSAGYHTTEDEWETMGIDDREALMRAQAIYAQTPSP